MPSQYQLITLRSDRITHYARRYDAGERCWVGDIRVGRNRSGWHHDHAIRLADARAALPVPQAAAEEAEAQSPRYVRHLSGAEGDDQGVARDRHRVVPADDFLDRVAEATRVDFPQAVVTLRPEGGYLRVSKPVHGGGAEQWPVGVTSGPVTAEALDAFLSQVHARFASVDPSVRSEFVYGGPPAPTSSSARARQAGVQLRSFMEYQGLLDLRPLAWRQKEKLDNDQLYPAHLYIPQRYRIVDGDRDGEIRDGLIERAVAWLVIDSAQFVMVLGDFGRGKTAFLRQLTRILPTELPSLLPVLVELRRLEKAPSLDELLASTWSARV